MINVGYFFVIVLIWSPFTSDLPERVLSLGAISEQNFSNIFGTIVYLQHLNMQNYS